MTTHMTPTLAQHIITVYERMEAESVKVEGNQLYIGSLSVLVRSIASSTYYSVITRALYDGGYAALLDGVVAPSRPRSSCCGSPKKMS